MSVDESSPVGRDVQDRGSNQIVLHQYTDAYLNEGAARQDDYGQRCRDLLRLPAEARQDAWARAYRATHHTPIEYRQSASGLPEAVRGATEIVGDFTAELTRVVDELIAGDPA
jgi:hypothetical protein